jgi:hypothetical protein
VQSPNMEWIEERIVSIILNQDLSVSEAANEALIFLQNALSPQGLAQLLDPATLNWLFNNRAILMQVPKNPRLTEFIHKFLELGSAPQPEQEPPAPAPADDAILEPEPPPSS